MGEYLGAIADISVIVASCAAVYGVTAWRKVYIGRKKVDLAEEALEHFYKARDALKHMRSPLGFQGEGSSRVRRERESEHETQVLDRAFTLKERYNSHQEVFQHLGLLKHKFEARFGTSSLEPFTELNSIINDLLISSDQLARLWLRQDLNHQTPEQDERYERQLRENEAVFWNIRDDDEINTRIRATIENMEAICRPLIKD